ncbi:MAG: BLUF domain-containing protein [Chloroflexota bacterium]|nr:BLUF domain-containing protein [Chloroflexota bacterium]
MPLIALTYVSSESRPMTDNDLIDILKSARSNNTERNITGMLLYGGGYFIQALEGEESDVNIIYNKIRQDSRHGKVLLVAREQIEARAFHEWSMGFKNLHEVETHSLEGFNDLLDPSNQGTFFTDNPTRATKLLNLFVAKVNS